MKTYPLKATTLACLVALATAGSPVMAGSGDDQTSDIWARASLTTTYTLNRSLNPFKIETEVHNGFATLRGTVDSEVERDLAEELALGVDGIHKVDNQLQIEPGLSPHQSARGDAAEPTERSFMQKVEDANLTAKIKSQLLWNSNTSGLDIDVDTLNGSVSLSGNVESDAEAELAEQIARNTDDVRGVENNLNVGGAQAGVDDKLARQARDSGQQVSDAWITAKVKSALLYNRNVDGSDINVDTSNGVVSLRGRFHSDTERDQAVTIARSVRGVKDVKAGLNDS